MRFFNEKRAEFRKWGRTMRDFAIVGVVWVEKSANQGRMGRF